MTHPQNILKLLISREINKVLLEQGQQPPPVPQEPDAAAPPVDATSAPADSPPVDSAAIPPVDASGALGTPPDGSGDLPDAGGLDGGAGGVDADGDGLADDTEEGMDAGMGGGGFGSLGGGGGGGFGGGGDDTGLDGDEEDTGAGGPTPEGEPEKNREDPLGAVENEIMKVAEQTTEIQKIVNAAKASIQINFSNYQDAWPIVEKLRETGDTTLDAVADRLSLFIADILQEAPAFGKMKKLGAGSTRVVYANPNNRSVYKVAVSKFGIAQNKNEAKLSEMSPLFAKVVKAAPDFKWIEMERLDPDTKKVMAALQAEKMSMHDLNELEWHLDNKEPYSRSKTVPLAAELERLGKKFKLGDFSHSSNWGVGRLDNKLKLIDYGYAGNYKHFEEGKELFIADVLQEDNLNETFTEPKMFEIYSVDPSGKETVVAYVKRPEIAFSEKFEKWLQTHKPELNGKPVYARKRKNIKEGKTVKINKEQLQKMVREAVRRKLQMETSLQETTGYVEQERMRQDMNMLALEFLEKLTQKLNVDAGSLSPEALETYKRIHKQLEMSVRQAAADMFQLGAVVASAQDGSTGKPNGGGTPSPAGA